MKPAGLYLISIITCMLIVPDAFAADKLGSIKVYKSFTGNPDFEMTLVRLGDEKERRVLAYFKTSDFAIDGEHNIYHGQCETTRCNTIIYKVIGGSTRNFISTSGYFGDYFEVLLQDRQKPLAVYFDKKQTKKVTSKEIYSQYLASVGRGNDGQSNAYLDDDIQALQLACKSKVKVEKNINAFSQENLLHLVGMGKYYIKEIAAKCADADYREELTKINTIHFLPEKKHKKPELKTNELFVYLSEKTYNPSHEARFWLNSL